MSSTYDVILRLRDQASGPARSAATALQGAGQAATHTAQSVQSLTDAELRQAGVLRNTSGQLTNLRGQYLSAAQAADRMNAATRTSGGGFGGLTERIRSVGAGAQGVGGAMGQLTSQIRGAGAAAAAFAAGAAVQGLFQLASNASKADTQLRIYQLTLSRLKVDGKEADAMVERLADQFGVMPNVVQDSVTQLLRAGASLKQIEALMKAGGASALAFGRDATAGFESITGAVVTGQSDLLNGIGIAQNLSTAYSDMAKATGKSAEELTDQQKIQAATTLLTKATSAEVETLAELTGGLTGEQSKANRAMTEAGNTIGRLVLPYVAQFMQWVAKAATAVNEWIKQNVYLKPSLIAIGNVLGGLGQLTLGWVRLTVGAVTGVAAAVGQVIGRMTVAAQNGFTGLTRAAQLAFKGDFTGAKAAALEARASVINAFDGLGSDLMGTVQKTVQPALAQIVAGGKQLATGAVQGWTTYKAAIDGVPPVLNVAAQGQAQVKVAVSATTPVLDANTDSTKKNTDASKKSAEEKGREAIAFDKWKDSLKNATKAQLEKALAAAQEAGQSAKYAAIKAELERRETAETRARQAATRASAAQQRQEASAARQDQTRAQRIRDLVQGYGDLRQAVLEKVQAGTYDAEAQAAAAKGLRELSDRAADYGVTTDALVAKSNASAQAFLKNAVAWNAQARAALDAGVASKAAGEAAVAAAQDSLEAAQYAYDQRRAAAGDNLMALVDLEQQEGARLLEAQQAASRAATAAEKAKVRESYAGRLTEVTKGGAAERDLLKLQGQELTRLDAQLGRTLDGQRAARQANLLEAERTLGTARAEAARAAHAAELASQATAADNALATLRGSLEAQLAAEGLSAAQRLALREGLEAQLVAAEVAASAARRAVEEDAENTRYLEELRGAKALGLDLEGVERRHQDNLRNIQTTAGIALRDAERQRVQDLAQLRQAALEELKTALTAEAEALTEERLAQIETLTGAELDSVRQVLEAKLAAYRAEGKAGEEATKKIQAALNSVNKSATSRLEAYQKAAAGKSDAQLGRDLGKLGKADSAEDAAGRAAAPFASYREGLEGEVATLEAAFTALDARAQDQQRAGYQARLTLLRGYIAQATVLEGQAGRDAAAAFSRAQADATQEGALALASAERGLSQARGAEDRAAYQTALDASVAYWAQRVATSAGLSQEERTKVLTAYAGALGDQQAYADASVKLARDTADAKASAALSLASAELELSQARGEEDRAAYQEALAQNAAYWAQRAANASGLSQEERAKVLQAYAKALKDSQAFNDETVRQAQEAAKARQDALVASVDKWGKLAQQGMGLLVDGLEAFGGMSGEVADGWREDLGRMASDLMGIGTSIAKGDWIGAAVQGLQVIANWFTRNKRAAEEARKATEDYHKGFSIIDSAMADRWRNVSTYTTGFLFWQTTHYVETLDELRVGIAQALEKGMIQGAKTGLKGFLKGEGNVLDGLRAGLRESIEDGIITALINGAIFKGAIGDLLAAITDAMADGDMAAVDRLIGDLSARLPAVAAQLEQTTRQVRASLDRYLPSEGSGSGGDPYTITVGGGTPGTPGTAAPATGGGVTGTTIDLSRLVDVGDGLARLVKALEALLPTGAESPVGAFSAAVDRFGGHVDRFGAWVQRLPSGGAGSSGSLLNRLDWARNSSQ